VNVGPWGVTGKKGGEVLRGVRKPKLGGGGPPKKMYDQGKVGANELGLGSTPAKVQQDGTRGGRDSSKGGEWGVCLQEVA